MGRDSVFREDVHEEMFGDFFGGDLVGCRNEDGLFRKSVDNDEDGGICVGFRKLFDKVHRD